MRSAMLLVLCSTAAAAQPLRVAFTVETLPVPGNQAGDTALLRDRFNLGRDYVFGSDSVNNGFFGFLVDGGSGLASAFGPVGGVDAVPPMEALPTATAGGLVVASASTAGNILFYTSLPDGGFVTIPNGPIVVATPRALALADFADAGSHLFANTTGNSLRRWRLVEDGGRVDAVAGANIPLPFAAQAVAVSTGLRRVYASIGIGGVVEIDPLAMVPTVVNVIDAGAMSLEIAGGLAVYPQVDGGALLITSVPARDLFRVYQARPGLAAVHLADFVVTAPDGGRQVRGGDHLDVWPGLFGGPNASPMFDGGVLVVCDRQSSTGANYKLIPWPALANAASPRLPIDIPGFLPRVVGPKGPLRVPYSLASEPEPSANATVSFWPGRDSLFATFQGLSAYSVSDLSRQFSVSPDRAPDGGADGGLDGGDDGGGVRGFVGGVDAVPDLFLLNPLTANGMVAMTSTSDDAGALTFFTGGDGGLIELGSTALPLEQTGSVAVLDLANFGAFAFVAGTQPALFRYELSLTDAGLTPLRLTDLALPDVASSVIASASNRVLYVAAGTEGVLEVDPFLGTVRQVVDAGSAANVATGLALYPQVDGGALLLTAVPGKDLFRVYRVHPEPINLLAEFQVIAPLEDGGDPDAGQDDGGEIVRGGGWLDVSVSPLGKPDGGAWWPTGALAIGTARDGGIVHLISWGDLALAADPPLPIDRRAFVSGASDGGRDGGTDGGAGGGAGGGGAGGGSVGPRAGGRGGGGVIEEPPPPGCCNGAPSASVLPALGFLYWLRRFGRRRAR